MTETTRSFDIATITTYQSGVVQAKAYRMLNAYFTKCLKPHGLTSMQWFIIGLIHDAGEEGISMSELAEKLGSTLPTLAEATAVLELKGWLVKATHAHDGRARVLTVAPDRRATCDVIEDDLREQLRKNIYSKISRKELVAYINVLYKLSGS